MAEAEQPQDQTPKKSLKKPILVGVLLAVLFGAGGFYATWSGMILSGDGLPHGSDNATVAELPAIEFVPMDPLVISLGPIADNRHLRMTTQIEVNAGFTEEITKLLPRIADLMNSYLHAISPSEFDDPAALVRMRAQLLRRIQIVTGQGRVRDLLVTEFVLN